jgi:hypothetical protein
MRATVGVRETASLLPANKKPLLKLGGKKGRRKEGVAFHHLKLEPRRVGKAERRQLRQQR